MSDFRQVVGIATVLGIVSCGGWPPYQQEAVEYFEQHRDDLEDLRIAMLETPFIEVYEPDLLGNVQARSTLEDPLIPIVTQDAARIGELIDRAGVSSVAHLGQVVYFSLRPKLRSDVMYLMRFGSGPSEQIAAEECRSVASNEHESGHCRIDLTQRWWLEYQWYPNRDD